MGIVPPQGGGSDYRFRVVGVMVRLWEPIHGGHTEL